MIGIVLLLFGIILIWIGATNRGAAMWTAVFGSSFKPLGFGG